MNTFFRNSLSRLLSQGAGKLSVFIWSMMLARRLNPEGFGAYMYIAAVAVMIGMISDYGLANLTIRDVARALAVSERALTHTMALRTLLALFAYALYAGLVFALPGFDGVIEPALIFGLTIFTVSWINGYNAILNAHEQLHWSSFMNALTPLRTLTAGLLLLAMGWGLLGAAVASVFAGAAVLAAEISLFRAKRIGFSRSLSLSTIVNLLRRSFPFFLVALLSTVNVSIDSVLLESLSGKQAVGLYSAAFKLLVSLMILPAAISDAVFPIWSRDAAGGSAPNRLALRRVLRWLFIAGVLTAGVILAAAEPLIRLLYGAKFVAAGPALRLLSLALVFMFLSAPLTVRLMVANRLRAVLITFALVVAADILGNLLLIPRCGLIGAAAVRLFAEALNFSLQILFISKAHLCPAPATTEDSSRSPFLPAGAEISGKRG